MTIRAFDRLPKLRADPENIGQSIALLGTQIKAGWEAGAGVFLPPLYLRVHNIAVCGMGGSHLGLDILRSVLVDVLPIPCTIIADYRLPAWVGEDTLVIASSYSGSTEETVAAMNEAIQRGAKILALCSGGKLAAAARRAHVPLLAYPTDANPSGQPRLGLGYPIGAVLRIWHALGYIRVNDDVIERLVLQAQAAVRRYGPSVPAGRNPAKRLGVELSESIPLLIGGGWSAGNLHTFANQINENAKTFAAWYLLPDLNHHLLEGLRHQRMNRLMHAVAVHSPDDHPRVKRRSLITKEIMKKAGIITTDIQPHGATSLERAIDLLAFTSYTSWYMSLARRVAAAPIPTVDELKRRLSSR